MTYAAREQSDYAGHPLELYRFAMGDALWLFTSADQEVAFGEDLYQPVFIRRGGFTRTGDARKSSMDIEIAATNPLALQFRSGWLPSIMVVTVYRHHYEDNEFSVLWKGRLTGCSWSGSIAKLATDSAFTLFKRAGLRRVYQIGCPHQLYGGACGVDPDVYAVAGTVTAATGAVIEVAGAGVYADGYFTGGMLLSGDDRRMIVSHNDVELVLIDAIEGLAPASQVTLWPGCDRSTATCQGRFANIPNFGGLPFLPKKNPFAGDALV